MVSGLDWDLGDAVDPAFGARFAAALAGQAPDELRALLAPEGNWHVGGNGPLAGTYAGADRVLALLDDLRSRGVAMSVFDNLVSDAHLGLLLALEKRAGAEKLSAYVMWLMHVDDGQVGECFWYFEDPTAFEALLEI
jgi:hypothetical protein